MAMRPITFGTDHVGAPRSEEDCRAFLERLRWPDGVRCPRCSATSGISHLESRGQFDCDRCGYQFSVRVGTALHASHVPLRKWLRAVEVVTASDGHVSTNELRRAIGISYKTAWHLGRVIRAARPDGTQDPFRGTLERLIGAEPAIV